MKIKKGKIALFQNLMPGGAKRVLSDYVDILCRDFEIDEYCFSEPDPSFYDYSSKLKSRFVFPFSPTFFPRITNPYTFTPILLVDQFRLTSTLKKMAHQINAGKYTFAFIHHDRFMQNIPLSLYLRTPSIAYCQEPFRFFSEPRFPSDRKVSAPKRCGELLLAPYYRFLRSYSSLGIHHSTTVFANSQYTKEAIRREYGSEATVSYMGIHSTQFYKGNSRRENRILSVGTLNWRKGHDLTIRALCQVPLEHRPLLCIITASDYNPSEKAYLETLASQSGVSIEFKFGVSQQSLAELYATSLITICSAVKEPFGLVPLESMASGTPVIATNEGGHAETIVPDKNGFLVHRDPTEIAAKIRKLQQSDTLYANMSDFGFDYVRKNWDWASRSHAFLKLVHSTIAEIYPRS